MPPAMVAVLQSSRCRPIGPSLNRCAPPLKKPSHRVRAIRPECHCTLAACPPLNHGFPAKGVRNAPEEDVSAGDLAVWLPVRAPGRWWQIYQYTGTR